MTSRDVESKEVPVEETAVHTSEDNTIEELAVQKPTSTEKWIIWISFGLAIYVQGLSTMTLSVYLNTAAAAFNGLVQYTTLSTVESIIAGVGNVVLAKVADVFGRPLIFAVSIGCWVLGTIVLATAHNIGTMSAGMIFYSFGSTGLTFSRNLIVADLVPAD